MIKNIWIKVYGGIKVKNQFKLLCIALFLIMMIVSILVVEIVYEYSISFVKEFSNNNNFYELNSISLINKVKLIVLLLCMVLSFGVSIKRYIYLVRGGELSKVESLLLR